MEKNCYCQSGLPLADCCGPLLAGETHAATAEALMRSRFSANVVRDCEYLLKTWHPDTRPKSMNLQTIPPWCSLTVLSSREGQPGDSSGMVEFRAVWRQGVEIGVLHEKSRFVHADGCWYYLDGILM